MKRRVVITGMGAVTPTGNNVDTFWNSCKEGKVGIDRITKFDTSDFKVKLAAEVKDFRAADHMDPKAARRMEPFAQYAVAASGEAMEDAGINMEAEDPYRVGVIIGSGIGSLETVEATYDKVLEHKVNRVNPLTIPKMISNMAAGNVSIQFGLKGKCENVVTACATGTNCIGDAMRTIQYGEADIMLTGGTESCICPTGVAGFQQLTALSTETDRMRASIPFDKDRNGFVMGEGAGILVLEELSHAQKRGAHIYAELVGYGATADAYHITSPCEDGSGAAKAMEIAMREAGIEPAQIDYINAHGTSTHHNDLFETRAIRLAFGAHAENVQINSTKSMIGHLLGAAGGVEAIVCVKSIQDGFVHRTAGTKETDPECDLHYTIGGPVEKKITYAMSDSLGFGGHNAVLVFKAFDA
jgi:beta-ketoacyl-acyl-carrier-protein synthase II